MKRNINQTTTEKPKKKVQEEIIKKANISLIR